MTKQDLIELVSRRCDVTKQAAREMLETLFAGIQESLAKGDRVSVVGFGSFEVRERAPRKGRNPKTGDTMQIAASRTPFFLPSQHLRDVVKGRTR
jgi:DNA-binding protein HU-beta